MNIAVLHPQCRIRGGAIKMALLTARSLKQQGHTVIFYTFDHDPDCFPELQDGLTIITEKTKKRKLEQKSGEENSQSKNHRQEGVGSKDPSTHQPINPKPTFDTVDRTPSFWTIFRQIFPRIFPIISIAWDVRHVDIVIANNPPMQIVGVLAKFFSLFSSYHQRLTIIWWHHHVPWYYTPKYKVQSTRSKVFSVFSSKTWKSWFERHWIIPSIKYFVATSYYTAFCIEKYCGRKSTVIHPVVEIGQKLGEEDSQSKSHRQELVGSENQRNKQNQLNQINKDRPVVLFSHGRLELGKGFDTLVRIWKKLNSHTEIEQKIEPEKGSSRSGNEGNQQDTSRHPELDSGSRGDKNIPSKEMKGDDLDSVSEHGMTDIRLLIAGEGSLKNWLEEQGATVIPYREGLLSDLKKTENDILAIYLSTIDAFGMAPLEAQMAGFDTIILDKGGARETVLLDNNKQPMAQLIDTEEEILPAITYFIQQRSLHKRVSNVNFCHHTEYFGVSRLDADIRSLIDSLR